MRIIDSNGNGTVVGYDDGKLYKGTPSQLGYDEIVYEVTEDDDTVTRTATLGGEPFSSETLAKGMLTPEDEAQYQGWVEANPEQDPEPIRQQMLEAHYERLRNPQSVKVHREMLTEGGEVVNVERTILTHTWEAM